jgi:hypothetical protein
MAIQIIFTTRKLVPEKCSMATNYKSSFYKFPNFDDAIQVDVGSVDATLHLGFQRSVAR